MRGNKMIDAQKEKVGFFAENSRWIQPLIVAFIFLVAPNLADQYGGFKINIIVTGSLAVAAMVFAGIMARMTDTLAAKIFMWLIVATGAIALGVKFAQYT
jgi:uncharacterized membrane protein YccC